ncbi:unnamed protein product [Pedinophyceae sp. YPF-701]|nr:unnamed protein product [Pedinophyceae sp. YPF-701]
MEEHIEIATFTCADCYVYKIPPLPLGQTGHRAEQWDVNNWLAEVEARVVVRGDDLMVRLLEKESKNLFAECPVANNKPLSAALEKVVDSSRYFVLRVEDRATKRHAFLGFGFRERDHATSFTAALDDHRQQMRRQAEAQAMASRFQQDAAKKDYSLQPGQKVHVNVGGLRGASDAAAGKRLGLGLSGSGHAPVAPSLAPPPAAGASPAKLPPPPPPGAAPGGARAPNLNVSFPSGFSTDAGGLQGLLGGGASGQPQAQQQAPPGGTQAAANDWADFGDFP